MKRTVKHINSIDERSAVLYLRVSSGKQAESGLGLEAQEARCRAYAEAQGWTIRATYCDAGVSAKDLDRPELQRMLADLQPGDVIITYKMDRILRAVADFKPLYDAIGDAGAELVMVENRVDTSTAMGRCMVHVMLAMAQLEREQTSERTSAALQAKIARGERLGATPLGYKLVDGELTIDPEEMRTVARARELHAAGLSLRKIGAQLSAEGHRTKRGGEFGPNTVSKIISARLADALA